MASNQAKRSGRFILRPGVLPNLFGGGEKKKRFKATSTTPPSPPPSNVYKKLNSFQPLPLLDVINAWSFIIGVTFHFALQNTWNPKRYCSTSDLNQKPQTHLGYSHYLSKYLFDQVNPSFIKSLNKQRHVSRVALSESIFHCNIPLFTISFYLNCAILLSFLFIFHLFIFYHLIKPTRNNNPFDKSSRHVMYFTFSRIHIRHDAHLMVIPCIFLSSVVPTPFLYLTGRDSFVDLQV